MVLETVPKSTSEKLKQKRKVLKDESEPKNFFHLQGILEVTPFTEQNVDSLANKQRALVELLNDLAMQGFAELVDHQKGLYARAYQIWNKKQTLYTNDTSMASHELNDNGTNSLGK